MPGISAAADGKSAGGSKAAGKDILLFTAFTILLAVIFLASLCIGRFPVKPGLVFRILLGAREGEIAGLTSITRSVIWNIRLPRLILAMTGGMGLGICGTVFQGIFRNPLVSPGVVGVTSGSGFGAALAILIFGWGGMTQVFAFIFGGLALIITWTIAKRARSGSLLMFVLAGVIVNMFFEAMISLVKFLADSDDKLPTIVYWLMGSLSTASWQKASLTVPFILGGTVLLFLLRWRINLLSLGEETVKGLGINPNRIMSMVLVLTTLIVSSIVSVAGIVGWIGLIVPHISRMIVGTEHQRLIPFAALSGGIFFMVIDTLARSVSAQDIPLGILTALVGAPVFVALLLRSRGEGTL